MTPLNSEINVVAREPSVATGSNQHPRVSRGPGGRGDEKLGL